MKSFCGHYSNTASLSLLCFALLLGIFTASANVFAADWDYDTCISNSGDRGDIPSVQWACDQTEEGVNACSLWIGSSSDSNTLDIYVSKLTGTTSVSYWGMCTDYQDTTSDLWVDNDNDSIPDSKNLTRGIWSSPSNLSVNLDVSKFVSGVTPTTGGGYLTYSRNISVGRCNGENTSSCSSQDQVLNIKIPYDTFQARATATEQAGSQNSTTSGYTSTSVSGSSNKITIPCSNSGCDVNFTFDIKRTTAGNRNTSWAIQKRSATKNASGEWDWYNSGFFGTAPGSSGIRGQTVRTFSETLDPGTTACYRIAFSPTYNSSSIATVATCVETLPITFQDYSKVYLTNTPSTSASTGWKSSGDTTSNTAWLGLTGCNDGCDITFEHGIRRTQGLPTATSSWQITDTGPESTQTFPAASPSSYSTTIKTGQVYCRKLTFDRKIAYNQDSGTVETTEGRTRACAYAVGTYSSSIDIKAKKSTSSTWLDAAETSPIYAKPTDIINLRGSYTPRYQTTYNLKPYLVKIGSASIINNGTGTIQNVFNSQVTPFWNNAFSIKLSDNFAPFSELAESNSIGNANNYRSSRDYTVSPYDPGNTITATALTNSINSAKTTPKQVGFTYSASNGFTATINKDSISDSAYIKIPYNFNNSTCISSKTTSENDANGCIRPDVERIAYAGETASIRYQINVGQRANSTVGGTYATIVKNAKWKLRICINENDNCTETSEQTGNLNTDGLLAGSSTSEELSVNIPDVAAGTRVCVSSAVFPASVNGDTDLNPAGNGTWGYSTPSCFKVAKRPSLQILGGNIYTGGSISTATSIKKHLSGVSESYSPEATYTSSHVFGSWGELGLIASGAVTGLSSGATLSYLDGSSKTSICDRSPLTFANYPCTTRQQVGLLGNSVAVRNIQSANAKLSSKYLYRGTPTVTESTVDLANEDGKMKDDSVYYYYNTADLTIPASTISKNRIKIVHSTGNITITGNLTYADEAYASFDELPKLLIYANNIAIDCQVSRIDAILVAESQVITCNNFEGDYTQLDSKITAHINDEANSHPLTVNGAIISSRLIANRTYGAATGTNSGIPAESINFDPTLYRWGGDRMESSTVSTNFNVAYQREQAPRY